MPDSAAEIPPKYKEVPWARLGVDVDHDFDALYVVPAEKGNKVSNLKPLPNAAERAGEGKRPKVSSGFPANPVTVEGKPRAQGRDFTSVGELRDPANILH